MFWHSHMFMVFMHDFGQGSRFFNTDTHHQPTSTKSSSSPTPLPLPRNHVHPPSLPSSRTEQSTLFNPGLRGLSESNFSAPPPPRSKFSTDLDLIWIFWDWKTRTCAYNRKTLIPALFYVYCGGSQSIVETSYNHCLQKLPIRIRYELLLGFRTSTWYM